MAAVWHKKALLLAALALLVGTAATRLLANDEEVAVERHYTKTPDAPRGQTQAEAPAVFFDQRNEQIGQCQRLGAQRHHAA